MKKFLQNAIALMQDASTACCTGWCTHWCMRQASVTELTRCITAAVLGFTVASIARKLCTNSAK